MPNAPRPDNPARSIRVEDDLWNAVKLRAMEDGTTVTNVILSALVRYAHPRKRLSRKERSMMARAWDEGAAKARQYRDDLDLSPLNPYREDAQ